MRDFYPHRGFHAGFLILIFPFGYLLKNSNSRSAYYFFSMCKYTADCFLQSW